MKKILTVSAMALCLGWGQATMATPVYLDVADTGNGSKVELSNVDTGLSVLFGRDFWGIGENTKISASLASGLGGRTMTLNDGASWEIDFITFGVFGTGIGSFDIEATLAFDAPSIPGFEFTGDGGWGTIDLGLRGTYSAGALWWDNPAQALTLADGNTLQISLEQGFVLGRGNDYTLSATITNLGGGTVVSNFGEGNNQPAPVPEPATLLLFGTGMVGLASLRRRPKKG